MNHYSPHLSWGDTYMVGSDAATPEATSPGVVAMSAPEPASSVGHAGRARTPVSRPRRRKCLREIWRGTGLHPIGRVCVPCRKAEVTHASGGYPERRFPGTPPRGARHSLTLFTHVLHLGGAAHVSCELTHLSAPAVRRPP